MLVHCHVSPNNLTVSTLVSEQCKIKMSYPRISKLSKLWYCTQYNVVMQHTFAQSQGIYSEKIQVTCGTFHGIPLESIA